MPVSSLEVQHDALLFPNSKSPRWFHFWFQVWPSCFWIPTGKAHWVSEAASGALQARWLYQMYRTEGKTCLSMCYWLTSVLHPPAQPYPGSGLTDGSAGWTEHSLCCTAQSPFINGILLFLAKYCGHGRDTEGWKMQSMLLGGAVEWSRQSIHGCGL